MSLNVTVHDDWVKVNGITVHLRKRNKVPRVTADPDVVIDNITVLGRGVDLGDPLPIRPIVPPIRPGDPLTTGEDESC